MQTSATMEPLAAHPTGTPVIGSSIGVLHKTRKEEKVSPIAGQFHEGNAGKASVGSALCGVP